MATEVSSSADTEQIRAIVDHWVNAVRAKDSWGLTYHLAPDVLLFDLINPLQSRGSDAIAQRAEQWLSSFEGPIEYEMHDLQISASDDVAFCHSLNQVQGTKVDGEKIGMFWRATVCFRKIDGQWLVTHEHSSVPFDVTSGKASLALKP